ncbi:MAG: hypothetical protein CME33_26565 [Gimesia sp.]|nr:hypothetical protein [Gimesia sp.]
MIDLTQLPAKLIRLRPAPPVDSLHVLLTEDCPDQGRLYLGFLQMAGAEVTLECSGRSAVDVVRKTPTLFDVIIMDFQMPEIDDIESTRQICELGYEGPIIAMTAFGSDELKQSWFQAGCNEYLEIPLKKSELIVAVLHHMKA